MNADDLARLLSQHPIPVDVDYDYDKIAGGSTGVIPPFPPTAICWPALNRGRRDRPVRRPRRLGRLAHRPLQPRPPHHLTWVTSAGFRGEHLPDLGRCVWLVRCQGTKRWWLGSVGGLGSAGADGLGGHRGADR